MISKELVEYIKKQQIAGKTRQEITAALKNNGWKDNTIHEAFEILETQNKQEAGMPSVTSLLAEAFRIYNQRFWNLISIGTVPIVASFALGFVQKNSHAIMAKMQIHSQPSVVISFTILLTAIVIMLAVWGQVALILAIKENTGWAESYKNSRPLIVPYLCTSIIAALLIVLGLILFLAPGVIVLVWLAFAPYAVITEKMKPLAALRYSKNITKGKFGAVLWRIVFGIIISIIFGMLAQQAALAVTSRDFSMEVTNILAIFWGPLITTYSFLVYKNVQKVEA